MRASCLSAVAIFGVLLWLDPVSAEEKNARLLSPLVITGTTDEGLYLYGHINKGILYTDDGIARRTYSLVDNSNSSTRLGAWATGRTEDGMKYLANLEFEWNPYATNRVNKRNSDDVDRTTHKLRKAEAIMESGRYGRLWRTKRSI